MSRSRLWHAAFVLTGFSVCAPLVASAAPAATLEERLYQEYNGWREPCQNYQSPPAGYQREGCSLGAVPREEPAPAPEVRATAPAPAPVPPAPVAETHSYTVYFGIGKADLTDSAKRTIADAAQAMKGLSDLHVTVSGYTSTLSSSAYNAKLSQRRADAVAAALVADGVSHEVIREQAFGESNLAVPTPDNTKMPANRRAVIEFTGTKAAP